MQTKRFRFIGAVMLSLISTAVMAQETVKEDQVRTCEAVLGDMPEARECAKIFKKSAKCCIQYDEKRLLNACGEMPNINAALKCFSQIHEVGFGKSELLPEYEPGLVDKFVKQWKTNVMIYCSKEPTKQAALECAIAQKSGIKSGYRQANDEIAREQEASDRIFQFCRKTFGDYWEGVEDCVKRQHAARKRLGQ